MGLTAAIIVGAAAAAVGSVTTAVVNKKAVDSNNATNKAIADETNALNYQMSQEQMQWSSEQQQKQNEYNSIGQQIQRGREAGVNPAAIIGQQYSSAVQSSLPSYSINPAQAAHMQPSLLGDNSLSSIGQSISSALQADAQIKQTKANTKGTDLASDYQKIQNSIAEQLGKLDIGLKKSEINKLSIDMMQGLADIEQTNEQVNLIKQNLSNLKEDEISKKIENAYKSDTMQANLNLLKSQCGYNDNMVEYYKALLPSQIGLNYANANHANAAARLSDKEIERVQSDISLLNIDIKSASYDFMLDKRFKLKERLRKQRQDEEGVKAAEWENSPIKRYTGVAKDLMIGFGATLAGSKAFGSTVAATKYKMKTNSLINSPGSISGNQISW